MIIYIRNDINWFFLCNFALEIVYFILWERQNYQ